MSHRQCYVILAVLTFNRQRLPVAIHPLTLDALAPACDQYNSLFNQPACTVAAVDFCIIQPRLDYALRQLVQPRAVSRFLLVKMPDEQAYLQMVASAVSASLPANLTLYGGHYQVRDHQVTLHPAAQADDNFVVRGEVLLAQWMEHEQLFGCLRQHAGVINLQPGLVHKANGGVLVLSLRALMAQPLLWLRLKYMVEQQRFHWYAPDESRPLPVSVPSLPLQLKVILVGDRDLLAEFAQLEPELSQLAIYSEFADEWQANDQAQLAHWCQWVQAIATIQQLPQPDASAWPGLICAATRHTGDQSLLVLSPDWICRQLSEMLTFCDSPSFNLQQFQQMLTKREWRENELYQRVQHEILSQQILLETDGQRVGQINALAVVQYPGHPRAFGEPSRLSCVVHVGDGELTDIERKAELGGNIHAKGMMIMQAFLLSALHLEQQLPFSASLTFEQSYSEVDGDSASMAELCVLISALANVPLYQHIAITGAVDQFGRSMAIGGVNEKIEGFFTICQQRGLSGEQGVIIPVANLRHLCLNQAVCDAVDHGQFHIWAVDHVSDALFLLTGLSWEGNEPVTLLQTIQTRIANAGSADNRRCRWLNWFNHN